MTIFEYITVAVSLVLALCFARLLDGVRSALNSNRRYWVHATWVFIKLTNPLAYWWTLWGYREAANYWNMLTFTQVVMFPAIMYLQVDSLVSHHPEHIRDWREHFYSQRRWFFSLNAILALLSVIVFSNFGVSAEPEIIGMTWASVGLFWSILGIVTENPKVQAGIVIFAGLSIVVTFWVLTFGPVASVE